jgi:high-affinity Fe2+/Pb2+ permease
MIDSAVFIGAMIIAIVEAIKAVVPGVSGAITTLVAIVVGALVAVFATHIGLPSITIVQGIVTALASVGVHTVASAVSSKN